MKILEVTDIYNPAKVWVIKITQCNHFYVNQKIKGKLFYNKFKRMTKRRLLDTGISL